MIAVMQAFLENIISFLSSEVGLWLVGAVIFGFIIRLLIQCISALLR